MGSRTISFCFGLLLTATSAPACAADKQPHIKIVVDTIPHSQQRYDTVGDWHFTKASNLEIRVTRLSDRR